MPWVSAKQLLRRKFIFQFPAMIRLRIDYPFGKLFASPCPNVSKSSTIPGGSLEPTSLEHIDDEEYRRPNSCPKPLTTIDFRGDQRSLIGHSPSEGSSRKARRDIQIFSSTSRSESGRLGAPG
jgi:hypothetical protein